MTNEFKNMSDEEIEHLIDTLQRNWRVKSIFRINSAYRELRRRESSREKRGF